MIQASILILISFLAGCKQSHFIQKTLKNTENAVCSDGTSPVYYVSTQPSNQQNDWLIFLQGGFGCYNNDSCLDRSINFNHLFSSKVYQGQEFTNPNGIFDRDCNLNPFFCKFNFAVLVYCSSDWWTGDAEYMMKLKDGTTQKIYFRGHNIVMNTVKQLLEQTKIKLANYVIISGNSAGGVGAQANADSVYNLLNLEMKTKNFIYRAILNSSVFLRGEGQKKFQCTKSDLCGTEETFIQGSKIWNNQIPNECIKNQKNAWECLMVDTMMKYQKTKSIVLMNKYDSWQWYSDGIEEVYENEKNRNIFEVRGREVKTLLKKSFEQNQALQAVFLSSCIFHTFTLFKEDFLEYTVGGYTPSTLIKAWITDGVKGFINETCEGMQCNSGQNNINCSDPYTNGIKHSKNSPNHTEYQTNETDL